MQVFRLFVEVETQEIFQQMKKNWIQLNSMEGKKKESSTRDS